MSLIELEYAIIVDNRVEEKVLAFSKDLIKVSYKRESLFVIKVEGESMQPMIMDNSLVVADLSQDNIIHDAVYIVTENNNTWIKQACINNDEITFVSINKVYCDVVFKEEEVKVIARAILTFTSLP